MRKLYSVLIFSFDPAAHAVNKPAAATQPTCEGRKGVRYQYKWYSSNRRNRAAKPSHQQSASILSHIQRDTAHVKSRRMSFFFAASVRCQLCSHFQRQARLRSGIIYGAQIATYSYVMTSSHSAPHTINPLGLSVRGAANCGTSVTREIMHTRYVYTVCCVCAR